MLCVGLDDDDDDDGGGGGGGGEDEDEEADDDDEYDGDVPLLVRFRTHMDERPTGARSRHRLSAHIRDKQHAACSYESPHAAPQGEIMRRFIAKAGQKTATLGSNALPLALRGRKFRAPIFFRCFLFFLCAKFAESCGDSDLCLKAKFCGDLRRTDNF